MDTPASNPTNPVTNDNFDRAFEYVLRNEGGYSNHPADSGGATKYGITISTLSRWRGKVCTVGDVQTMGRDEAKDIYRAWYWTPLRLDHVSDLVKATVLFDAAVLFGVRVAAIRAQRVVQVKMDGIVGPVTLKALNLTPQPIFVIGLQSELRSRINEIVRANPKNKVFFNGWNNRVDKFTTLIA